MPSSSSTTPSSPCALPISHEIRAPLFQVRGRNRNADGQRGGEQDGPGGQGEGPPLRVEVRATGVPAYVHPDDD